MSVNKIAARYAKTLIDLSKEQGSLDATFEDVKGFKEACSNRDLYLLLKSPIVNTEKKLSILKAIFTGKVSPLMLSFVNIITKKGREMHLPEICAEFINLYQLHNRISKVTITTANPMEAADLATIKAKLLSSEVTLDTLEIDTKIDASIIGGFIIQIGDRLYDASVLHKLDELKKQFSSNLFEATI